MKKLLVGTALGRLAYSFSHWKRLKTIPASNPEQAAFYANMAIADKLIVRLCPRSGTFIDIGAHIGTVLSSVHQCDPTVSLIAFEADPDKAAFLSSKYPYCRVHQNAVGDSASEVTFFIDGTATAHNSLVTAQHRQQTPVMVQMVTLDDILSDIAPDVMKIDVEGAELGVLRGGQRTIEQNRPLIMFESTGTGTNALGYSSAAIWEWFFERDFQIFYPDRLAHDAPPLKLDAFLDAHEYPRRTDNFFAVHDSKRVIVRDKARRILNI